jgi:hypothetical protein
VSFHCANVEMRYGGCYHSILIIPYSILVFRDSFTAYLLNNIQILKKSLVYLCCSRVAALGFNAILLFQYLALKLSVVPTNV